MVKVLESGWLTTGARTKELEYKITKYTNTSKAVCLSSASACMELTLRILGIGAGDEVITSAYTYTATAAAIAHVGAKTVLVDTALGSYEMDYDKVGEAITENTKVIISVDIGGCICDYDRLNKVVESKQSLFCAKNPIQDLYGRIVILADSAHGFGSKRDGVISGQHADFTCFSFHAVKNLTLGEGGAVVWRDVKDLDNEWLYQQYMLQSLHGQSKDAFTKNQSGDWEYDIVYLGYKYNMPDILAALGLHQMERYEECLNKRKNIIEQYNQGFLDLGLSTLNHYDEHNASCGHLYMVRIPGVKEIERNRIIVEMGERGIGTNVHFKPLPMMTAYKRLGFQMEDYPCAKAQYENEITLPLHTKLTPEDLSYVIENFRDVIQKMKYKN